MKWHMHPWMRFDDLFHEYSSYSSKNIPSKSNFDQISSMLKVGELVAQYTGKTQFVLPTIVDGCFDLYAWRNEFEGEFKAVSGLWTPYDIIKHSSTLKKSESYHQTSLIPPLQEIRVCHFKCSSSALEKHTTSLKIDTWMSDVLGPWGKDSATPLTYPYSLLTCWPIKTCCNKT